MPRIGLIPHACTYAVRCRYNAVNFHTNIHKRHPIVQWPVRARYGVSFVDAPFDWHSDSVPAIIYAQSYYIGPRYNGTRLYLDGLCVIRFTITHVCLEDGLFQIISRSLLTHLPLEKMADILADDIFKWILFNENDRLPIQITLKFDPMSPIVNKPALVR